MVEVKVRIKTMEELMAMKGAEVVGNGIVVNGVTFCGSLLGLCGSSITITRTYRGDFIEEETGMDYWISPWMCSEWEEIDPRECLYKSLQEGRIVDMCGDAIDVDPACLYEDWLEGCVTYIAIGHGKSVLLNREQTQDLIDRLEYLLDSHKEMDKYE